MIKHLISFTVLLFFVFQGNSQSIEEIKADQSLMWGQGKASSLDRADRYALRDLTSQISTMVESDFEYIIKEQEGETEEFLTGIVKTYSSATLSNALRLVDETPEGVTVIRYMKRDEVGKIFEKRGKRIKGYVATAIEAEAEGRLGDALRYYYWAQALLFSHPDNQEMSFNYNGVDRLLYAWIPDRINRLFTLTTVNVIEIESEANTQEVIFEVYYNGKKAYNLDYSYWTGSDWTALIGAANGKGIIELFGEAECSMEKIRLKIEYQYASKCKQDPELPGVMEVAELPYYKKAVKILEKEIGNSQPALAVASQNTSTPNFNSGAVAEPVKEEVKPKIEPKNEVLVKDSIGNCVDEIQAFDVVQEVLTAIDNKNSNIKHLFTDEGYEIYTKLLGYGKVKRLNKGNAELKYVCLDQQAIIRSVPFIFNFEHNNQKFVENVSFTVDSTLKISNISFALNELALKGILRHSKWSDKSKWHIIDFMENYKTAYALERIDYIDKIFADNALIIVGKKLQKAEPIDNMYGTLSNDDYTYVKVSKKDYLERVERVFNSNEFVNIQFEESNVKKRDRNSEVYGIQIAQNYHSTNYADKGYLFLMVDLNDTLRPKIYVRSWQPEKNEDGSIMGLGVFFN